MEKGQVPAVFHAHHHLSAACRLHHMTRLFQMAEDTDGAIGYEAGRKKGLHEVRHKDAVQKRHHHRVGCHHGSHVMAGLCQSVSLAGQKDDIHLPQGLSILSHAFGMHGEIAQKL